MVAVGMWMKERYDHISCQCVVVILCVDVYAGNWFTPMDSTRANERSSFVYKCYCMNISIHVNVLLRKTWCKLRIAGDKIPMHGKPSSVVNHWFHLLAFDIPYVHVCLDGQLLRRVSLSWICCMCNIKAVHEYAFTEHPEEDRKKFWIDTCQSA